MEEGFELRKEFINMQKTTFGAGCFWGVEDAFRQVDGVTSTAVGYSGGHFENPTYEDVCADKTGHAEVVKVDFDENRVFLIVKYNPCEFYYCFKG